MYSDGMDAVKLPLTSDQDNSTGGGTDGEFQTQHLSISASKFAQHSEAPTDKGNAVYLTFILYGIGVLLPFNVIMACLDFYFITVSMRSYDSLTVEFIIWYR